jgi:hypothetical protein
MRTTLDATRRTAWCAMTDAPKTRCIHCFQSADTKPHVCAQDVEEVVSNRYGTSCANCVKDTEKRQWCGIDGCYVCSGAMRERECDPNG